MLPPFSLGGIVLKQSSLYAPFGPQTESGNAPAGEGPKADPPEAASYASLVLYLLTSIIPGNTPIEPGKAS